MSNKHISDGGPAFPGRWYDFQPLTGEQVVLEQWDGMTLRDYFAAKAMQGLLAAQVHGFYDRPAKGPFASMAYEMADAMIRAREASSD